MCLWKPTPGRDWSVLNKNPEESLLQRLASSGACVLHHCTLLGFGMVWAATVSRSIGVDEQDTGTRKTEPFGEEPQECWIHSCVAPVQARVC